MDDGKDRHRVVTPPTRHGPRLTWCGLRSARPCAHHTHPPNPSRLAPPCLASTPRHFTPSQTTLSHLAPFTVVQPIESLPCSTPLHPTLSLLPPHPTPPHLGTHMSLPSIRLMCSPAFMRWMCWSVSGCSRLEMLSSCARWRSLRMCTSNSCKYT